MRMFNPSAFAESLTKAFADLDIKTTEAACYIALLENLETDDAIYGYVLTPDVVIMDYGLLEDYMFCVMCAILGTTPESLDKEMEVYVCRVVSNELEAAYEDLMQITGSVGCDVEVHLLAAIEGSVYNETTTPYAVKPSEATQTWPA